jgi:hypothetical protein
MLTVNSKLRQGRGTIPCRFVLRIHFAKCFLFKLTSAIAISQAGVLDGLSPHPGYRCAGVVYKVSDAL